MNDLHERMNDEITAMALHTHERGLCIVCEGTGRSMVRLDFKGEAPECPVCHGTGKDRWTDEIEVKQ